MASCCIYKIHNDIIKLSYATYFTELVNYFVFEQNESGSILRLILNTLYVLCEKNINNVVIKAVFEMKLMCISGYMPDLIGCTSCCGISDAMLFSVTNGTLICRACCKDTNNFGFININLSVIETLRHIAFCDDKKLFSFIISDNTLKILSLISEEYCKKHFAENIKSLDYLKDIILYETKK